jgi:type I restriction enzyme R subunit
VLQPIRAQCAWRFNLWVGREKEAGRIYTEEQMAWLTLIRDHIAANAEVAARDFMDIPAFADRGGIVKARLLFGERLPALLDDLTNALVA